MPQIDIRQIEIRQIDTPRSTTGRFAMPRFEHRRFRRSALLLVGLAFVLAVWPLGIFGLSGGVWQESGRSAYVETFRAIHVAVSLPPERLP